MEYDAFKNKDNINSYLCFRAIFFMLKVSFFPLLSLCSVQCNCNARDWLH